MDKNLPSPTKYEPLLVVTLPLTFTLPLNLVPNCTDSTTKPLSANADAVTEPLAILNTSCDNADNGKLNKPAPLPVNIDADTGNWKLANVVTTNPVSGAIDAVAEPLAILFILKESADSGISNNPIPLPENIPEPVGITTLPLTNRLPLMVEPLATDVTKNPFCGDTDAVTLPEVINVDNKASCVNAERGISNNLAPLPLYDEPLFISIPPLTKRLPLNVEPLTSEVTKNPLFGDTDAVTLPLPIKVAVRAGMLNNWEPSPIKNDEDTLPVTNTFPINVEPLATDVTKNPLLGDTDAVTEPDFISVDINASSVNAERGIFDKPAPLPLKNPLPVGIVIFPLTNRLPLNIEPLAMDVTKNPMLGDTDAVTEPLLISVEINASSVKAVRGIFDKPAPLPLKNPLPVYITMFPLTKRLPLNVEPLTTDFTKNPVSGATDAVTEPLLISVEINASTVKAERGISNNLAPLPLYEEPDINSIPPLTNNEPVNCEPLIVDSTLKPYTGLTEAVTLPLAILNTSAENADNGILNKPSPLPLNDDADTVVLTNKPKFGEIDAVALPLAIRVATIDSILSADNGIFDKPSPLPLKNPLPDGIVILPLTNNEPVKVEPLATDVTKNPLSGDTDAVTLPLAITVANGAFGKFIKFEPSPKNEPVNEPLNEPVASAIPIKEPVKLPNIVEPDITYAFNLSLTSTEPVNCWISINSSPNILLPDEYITDEDM